MAARPTIAMVPGSFHRDGCLKPLVQALHERGIESQTTALESSGKSNATFTDHVAWIRKDFLTPLADAGKEIILLLHSFAGGPGGATARGFTLPERRAKGLQGGVIGSICVSAFVLVERQSSNGFLAEEAGAPPEWRDWDEGRELFVCKTPRETFYGDVEDEALARELVEAVVGHSALLFEAPTPSTALFDSFFDGRRAYVRTLEDRALPLQLQDVLVHDSGLEWIRRDMSCGHSPFASRPEELAEMILELEAVFEDHGRQ